MYQEKFRFPVETTLRNNQELHIYVAESAHAARVVVENHYLHRRPPISHAYGLSLHGETVGVVTFGVPASRHVQRSVCPAEPDVVLELNRLWIRDGMPKNTASWFVSRVLRRLPPRIVFSYSDTAYGHMGFVYRALNFRYAGWTDMERKTPRYDYIVPGKHTRDAFRGGEAQWTERIRRNPKVRYWTTTGTRAEACRLVSVCGWPRFNWKLLPPPTEHVHLGRKFTQAVSGISHPTETPRCFNSDS